MSHLKSADAVVSRGALGVYDFSLDPSGDIETKESFDTSILMSIFCERRALPSEMPISHYRRGWIGNESTPGFEIGSKLWLYEQSRITRSVLNGVSSVIKEGLEWMVEDKIAESIEVRSFMRETGTIETEISIARPSSKVEKRYFELWENTGR